MEDRELVGGQSGGVYCVPASEVDLLEPAGEGGPWALRTEEVVGMPALGDERTDFLERGYGVKSGLGVR